VLSNLDDLLAAVEYVYGDDSPIKALRTLAGVRRFKSGEDPKAVAKWAGTTVAKLREVAKAKSPVKAALGCSLDDALDEKLQTRVRRNLGQLLVGHLAERGFEKLYKTTMGTDQLRLEDDRAARTDTDYRVLNGNDRRVFRINIKFFGSRFRNAKELVGLDPDDCFALATYKIKSGLDKQDEESLPYLFVIVGVPDLTGDKVGTVIPENLRHLCALIHHAPKAVGKRGIEDAIVGRLMHTQPDEVRDALDGFREQIDAAQWHVLSARRADQLLREKLFERVYAVRVRGFARNYPNAELDMHFSLKTDLTPLLKFLNGIKQDGLNKAMVQLERGTM